MVDADRGFSASRPAGGRPSTIARSRSAGASSARCSRSCCCTPTSRLDGAADRRAVGRAAAARRSPRASRSTFPRLRKQLGDGRLVTRAPGYVLQRRAARARRRALRAARRRGRRRRSRDGRRRSCARRSRCGAGRRSPTSPTSRSRRRRSPVSRSCAWRRSSSGSTPTSPPVATPSSSASWRGWSTQHPLRERLRGQLMLCLYRSGRQAEALETYQAARRGARRGARDRARPRLRELHQAILRAGSGTRRRAVPEPAAETRRGAFVGREAELAELVAGLDDAFAGRGRLFLLVGEPGIGKSRLAEELIAHARARGARVLVGRCWEAGGAPAYWPWVQSLRAYVRDSDTAALRSQLGAGAAELAQIVPELRERFPDLPEPLAPESEGARFRLFDAIAEFLRNAAEGRPIVLVLDDLHAADAPSLLLLRFLARGARLDAACSSLGAYRDVDPVPGRPLTDMLAELAREPAARGSRWAGSASARSPSTSSSRRRSCLARAGRGAARRDRRQSALRRRDRAAARRRGRPVRAPAAVRLAIPQSVREVIARRLTHLSRRVQPRAGARVGDRPRVRHRRARSIRPPSQG